MDGEASPLRDGGGGGGDGAENEAICADRVRLHGPPPRPQKSAKQQLAHSPGVWVSKKKRESIPEVEEPELVASHSDKFINNSFFRRVAHVQDLDDPFHRPRHLETLKSVGVDPHAH